MYHLDRETIEIESILARRVLVVKDLNSVSDVLISLGPLKDASLNIFHMLHIALSVLQQPSVNGRFPHLNALKRTCVPL